jgi:hypothetical protein
VDSSGRWTAGISGGTSRSIVRGGRVSAPVSGRAIAHGSC